MVKEYFITPVTHVRLLQGQTKTSCTNYPLTDTYYVFDYTHKVNAEDTGSFFCGKAAASHFLKLLNHDQIRLFDPLKPSPSSPLINTNKNSKAKATSAKWHPVAKQFHDALNIIVMSWNNTPRGNLSKYLKDVVTHSYRAPFDDRILHVNNIIGCDSKNRTVQDMIDDLGQGNALRKFDFSLLNQVLAKKSKPSNFG